MAVLVELDVAASSLDIGQATTTPTESHISLEQIVPTGNGAIPYFWAESVDFEAFETTVRGHDAVDELEVVTVVDGRRLYRVYWNNLGDFVDALTESDATILEGHGSDPWTFRLLFPTRPHVTAFRESCSEAGIPFEVRHVSEFSSDVSTPTFNLTDEQYEALQLAVSRGYYSIPREVTLAELAADVGISQQAMSERLRRGTAKVLVHLVDDDFRLNH
jgi:hypothetical protein